jgi:hypothetical protein
MSSSSSGSASTINTDFNTPANSLDTILYGSSSNIWSYYDLYEVFPTSYQAVYYSEWVNSINFVSSDPTIGWNYAIAVGGFECQAQAQWASAEIVAVNTGAGYYWGMMYPIEPLRTWIGVLTNVPIVDGQWMHFILYFNCGTETTATQHFRHKVTQE